MLKVILVTFCSIACLVLHAGEKDVPVHTIPLIPFEDTSPGHLCDVDDPDFDRLRYEEQIAWCRRNVSWEERQAIYDKYEIPWECRHRYTIDHIIPLSIGGSNSDKNLWPEHRLVKSMRDQFEYDIFLKVKAGELTQVEAVDLMMEEKYRVEEIWVFYEHLIPFPEISSKFPGTRHKKEVPITPDDLVGVSFCL